MRIPQVTDRITTERVKEVPAQALRAAFAGLGRALLAADRIKKQGEKLMARRAARDGSAGGGSPGAGAGAAAVAAPAVPKAVYPRAGSTRAESAPAAPAPAEATGPTAAAPAARGSAETRWRSLDQTGNVRLLSADELAEAAPADTAPTDADPADADPADADPADADRADADPADAKAADASPVAAPPVVGDPPPVAAPSGAEEAVAEEALPVPNYGSLTLPSLRARLRTLDVPQLRTLIEYEQSHAGRREVVAMFERRIAKLADGG